MRSEKTSHSAQAGTNSGNEFVHPKSEKTLHIHLSGEAYTIKADKIKQPKLLKTNYEVPNVTSRN